jgi:predicted PurR-regulated permease PerM
MKQPRPIVFWIGMIAAVIAALVLTREILLPFVAGTALAYVLIPLVNRIERWGLNRLTATLIVMGVLIIGLVAAILLTMPLIVQEVIALVEDVPAFVRRLRVLATDPARPIVQKLFGEGLARAEQSIGELTTLAAGWFDDFLLEVWSGGQALMTFLSLAIVTPVVACYVIFDWNSIIAAVDDWVPPARRDTVRTLATEIDGIFREFLRGQGAICLILGVFYAATLWAIGLSHGLIVGFTAGLISFIPYVGSLVGIVVASCIGVAQFWPDWKLILAVPAIFLVGQTISDYALSPYLVGRRINLHPVWSIFALFAFGNLFGLVGLLIAVPVAAAIGVLLRFAQGLYFASPFYIYGNGAERPATAPLRGAAQGVDPSASIGLK